MVGPGRMLPNASQRRDMRRNKEKPNARKAAAATEITLETDNMDSQDNYTFENQPSIPNPLDRQITAFFRSYDDPDTKHDYLNLFHPTESTLVFGGVSFKGRDGVRTARGGMLDPAKGPVIKVQHTLDKCFVLAGAAAKGKQEVIVNGLVGYTLKDGRHIEADFASYIRFLEPGGGEDLLAEFYQVYLDATELMGAIKEMMNVTEKVVSPL